MTMTLPKLTKKQQEILQLLYRYRFLNRIQIQQFMGHADKRRIITWLKDLRDKNYVVWIYSTDFTEKSKPAIYYLGLNGIRYLRTLVWDNDSGSVYQPAELHKRYREKDRTHSFIERSTLIASCCVALEAVNRGKADTIPSTVAATEIASTTANTIRTGSKDFLQNTPTNSSSRISYAHYTYYTEADYLDPDSDYHFLSEHETLRPNLCVVKQKGRTTTTYLLEIFDPTLPHYRVRSRLKAYVNYLVDSEWEGAAPEPVILLAFPTLYGLIYAKRRVKKLLLDEYYETEDIPEDLHIHFTTTEHLQAVGITANVWEEGRKRLGV